MAEMTIREDMNRIIDLLERVHDQVSQILDVHDSRGGTHTSSLEEYQYRLEDMRDGADDLKREMEWTLEMLDNSEGE